MKKIKLLLSIIILGLIVALVFQNQGFFMSKSSLSLDLLFIEPYQSPELANLILFIICFAAGVLVSFFLSLGHRFKTKKAIKQLNSTVDTHIKNISSLKEEIVTLKVSSLDKPTPPPSEGNESSKAKLPT